MQAETEDTGLEDFADGGQEEGWHELPFHNTRRRASLEEGQPLGSNKSERCGRRLSMGNVNASAQFCCRRSSLGEEVLRLNFLRRNFSNSSTSLVDSSRRSSLESDGSFYEPRRRSSLGAESLTEYVIEDEEGSEKQGEPPPEAVLGLQYVDDVFSVKRDLELLYHPRNCLNAQPQVSAPVRCTLVNWLVKVSKQLQFGPETVFLAVNLLDRFLACSAIASDCAQLLAVCALFVAAKMEESKIPGIGGLSVLCSSNYQRHHFRRMEILLLTKLRFALHAPSSWYFINYLALKACQLGYLDRTVCRFAREVAETCLCRYDIAQFLPSIQAAAALVYAATAINPQESSRFYPALLQDGLWVQHGRYISLPEEPDDSFPEKMVQQKFEHSLESWVYSAQCRSPLGGEDPKDEDFRFVDGTHYASSLQQSVLEDIMCHKEINFETSSTAIMELINVLMVLFSFHERCEIVHCSDLMKGHLAPYDQQSVLQTPNVDASAAVTEPSIAANNTGPSITAQTLLCMSSGSNNSDSMSNFPIKYSRNANGISQKTPPSPSNVQTFPYSREERTITKSAPSMTSITLTFSNSSCRIDVGHLPIFGCISRVRPTTQILSNSVTQTMQCSDPVNCNYDVAEHDQRRRDSGISTAEFEANV